MPLCFPWTDTYHMQTPTFCPTTVYMEHLAACRYLNFSSKNAVKDSCASAISCKSSSNENVLFIALMTWKQQEKKNIWSQFHSFAHTIHPQDTTYANYKLYQSAWSIYGLLTKHEVKMAGYSLRARTISSHLDLHVTSLVNAYGTLFSCKMQQAIPKGQDSLSLPSQVSNHCSAGSCSSCKLTS